MNLPKCSSLSAGCPETSSRTTSASPARPYVGVQYRRPCTLEHASQWLSMGHGHMLLTWILRGILSRFLRRIQSVPWAVAEGVAVDYCQRWEGNAHAEDSLISERAMAASRRRRDLDADARDVGPAPTSCRATTTTIFCGLLSCAHFQMRRTKRREMDIELLISNHEATRRHARQMRSA